MGLMRVYIETSVFGGYYDEEFEAVTQQFFQVLSQGKMAALISEALVRELEYAPEQVRALLHGVMERDFEPLPVSEEAVRLSQAYLRAGIVAEQYAGDALHVALATLARADVVVSWNFRHLVNPMRERAFNGVNIAAGYGLVSITTPAEVLKTLEVEDED